MIQIQKTKFVHNQKVIIKTGYYRGYKAIVIDYQEQTETQEDTTQTKYNTYKLKIEGLQLKQDYWIPEEGIFAYKKYILF
jgi:hypothetical protein